MDPNAKSQALERIKESQNVLITVSTNPSVDQLAAAIGLTLLLNKLDKHATAVFSGAVPSTLEFLKPEVTLEQTTDSLRDFIISLDKAKADKLRYKVEDEVVRIFITPYKTKLTEEDLIFSQGDYNVDVVIALGVDNKEHIDRAIVAHGRILHDATVVGVMAGTDPVDIGSINWQDPNASSLCEMLMSISESLQPGSVDNQIATAFLTGIVAMTDRFKNEKTTPKVMTMSAQLMAAGANQQLIAEELTRPEPQPEPEPELATMVEQASEESLTEVDESENDGSEGVISLHHDPSERFVDVEDDHVHIDDNTGDFSNADQLREAIEEVQKNKQTVLPREKVIAPPAQEPEQEYSPVASQPFQSDESLDEDDENVMLPPPEVQEELPKITHNRWGKEAEYLDHPPSSDVSGSEFTATSDDSEDIPSIENTSNNYSKYIDSAPSVNSPINAIEAGLADNGEDPLDDPLATIPQAGPLAAGENFASQSPLLSTQHDAESPRATEVPSTKDHRLSDDGETSTRADASLGPVIDNNSTLSEIESSVEQFENSVANTSSSSEEEARKAVMDAIGQTDTPYGPPNENIGAQFVPLENEPQPSSAEQQVEQQEQTKPPTVPPPIMTAFPIPGVEVVEPENSEQR